MKKILILSLLCTSFLGATDIGSDTAVTRFNTLQFVNNGDRVAGFAALDAGFVLGGTLATGTWDTFFPVSGPIALQNGTLDLNQDLIFHNVITIASLGNIICNGHAVDFSKVGCIPRSVPSCVISFLAEATQTKSVLSVEWSFDSEFVVIGEDSGTGDELFVYSWDGSTLTLQDSVNFTQDVNGVAWHPTNDWIAVARGSGSGDEIYTYTFDRSGGTLTLIDSLNLGGGGSNGALSVEWHTDGDHLAFGTQVSNNELRVYEIDTAGNFGTVTTVNAGADVNSVRWNFDGEFLGIGTDNIGGGDEIQVYEFTVSPLGLALNASFDAGGIVNEVAWNKAVGDRDIIAFGRPSGSDRIIALRHDSGAGTLTQIAENGAGTNALSVDWDPGENCLAAGLARNSQGSGGELRTFSFENDTLSLEDDAELDQDVNSVRWSSSGLYLAIGLADTGGGTPSLQIYRLDSEFAELNSVFFSDVQLFFDCNTTFQEVSITFSGNNLIHGKGNVLTFAPTFTLLLAENSSLHFKDVTVEGVSGTNIQGIDQTSTFTFQDTTFVLNNDYTFGVGSFNIVQEFKITGKGNKFIYTSDQVSTIKGGLDVVTDGCGTEGFSGCLVLDHGVTFSYDVIEPDLLELEDSASKIRMNSATLCATTSLQLTTGIFQIDGKSFLSSTNGIIFGDCTEANNLCVEILPAANLNITSGELIYNNV